MGLDPSLNNYSPLFYAAGGLYWIIVIVKLFKLRKEHGSQLMYTMAVAALLLRIIDHTNTLLFKVDTFTPISKSIFYAIFSMLVATCGIFADKRFFNPGVERRTSSDLKSETIELISFFDENTTFFGVMLGWNFTNIGLTYGQFVNPDNEFIMMGGTALIVLSFLFVSLTLCANARKSRIPDV